MRVLVGVCRKTRSLFKVFEVVEIQETFYNIPQERTVERWFREARGCRLSFKAFQGLTHPASSPTWRRYRGELSDDIRDKVGSLALNPVTEKWLLSTVRIAELLKAPAVVVQTPPRFGASPENAERAIKFFKKFRELLDASGLGTLIAWEPRGTWLDNRVAVLEVLQRTEGVIHVVDPLFNDPAVVGDTVYLRLHGKPYLNYRYKYSDEDFRAIASKLASYSSNGASTAYVLFNNVSMVEDAKRFREHLKAEGVL